MACMGPSKPSKKEVNKVYKSVLDHLEKEHDVRFRPEKEIIFPIMRAKRRDTLDALKKAIAEVLWQEACENF